MENVSRFVTIVVFAMAVSIFTTDKISAQDAAQVDSLHYKVEFENDQLRVLRISYGPGEKSVMHEHPEGVAVFLTDGQGKFTFPDGSTQETVFKAGEAIWLPAQKHQPENTGDQSFELIQIELKSK